MEPLMVCNLAGVKGGMVFVCADDPNCWSTQNEQDSRLLARVAEIPCLEPSSAQEAKEMVREAYEISERFEIPVMVRTVTRLNHSRGKVSLEAVSAESPKPRFYEKKAGFIAPPKHKRLHEKYDSMQAFLSTSPFNRLTLDSGRSLGLISSGNAYNYLKEALGLSGLEDRANILKIGSLNPPPDSLIKQLLAVSETVLVLEEIEPYLETHIRAMAYPLDHQPSILGKLTGHLPYEGELTTDRVLQFLSEAVGAASGPGDSPAEITLESFEKNMPTRSLAYCPGCPHMASLYEIREAVKDLSTVRGLIAGDIGCYGLGILPPYNVFDTHICMGASIGVACGLTATAYQDPIVSVLGDSTFFHSGMPALLNAVYNQHNITVIIMDNSIVAMTGHQPDPGTGVTATGKQADPIQIEAICRALGVREVRVVDPFQVQGAIDSIKQSIQFHGVSAVILRQDCALMAARKKKGAKASLWVDPEECTGCRVCVDSLLCPSLVYEENAASIDETRCTGCQVCSQICPSGAIRIKGEGA
jgi:indolepyruvate ferredoxin oxidoreductase alpha subunit